MRNYPLYLDGWQIFYTRYLNPAKIGAKGAKNGSRNRHAEKRVNNPQPESTENQGFLDRGEGKNGNRNREKGGFGKRMDTQDGV